jgi:hypothetical protein
MIGNLREEIGIADDMPYGGMPYDKIIPRYEITAMTQRPPINALNENFISPRNANDLSPYEDYARAQIIDWSTEAPIFESDQIRRDPSYSRSAINLRYNGNRGNTGDLPRHPELFIGFTGNDPRGVANDPRLDQFRDFMVSHASNIEPRMGKNDDNQLAERPWTNQSLSYDKKYIQQLTANNLKVFSSQKEGNPIGRNVNTDLATWGNNQNQIRSSNMGVVNLDRIGGDYDEYIELSGQVNSIIGSNLAHKKASSNVYKNIADHDFYNSTHNVNIGSGNNMMTNQALKNTRNDHIDIDSISNINSVGDVFNKKSLAASMGLAAKTAAMSKNSIQHSYNKQGMTSTSDHITNNISDNSNGLTNVGYNYATDIINIYKQVENNQKYKDSGENTNQGGYINKRTTEINKNVIHDTSSIANRLETVSSIVKGLKENSASSKRKIANEIISQNSMIGLRADESGINNGLTPATQYKKNIDGIDSAVFQKYVSNESKINKFQPAPKLEKRVHFSKTNDITNWKDSNMANYGKNVKYQDDNNRFQKNKNALDQMNWMNSKELMILKGKNPQLYNRVINDINNSVMDWVDSDIAIYGKVSHELEQHLMNLAQHTYDPETWNNGYNEQNAKKNKQIDVNRRSASNDPIAFGTNENELFQQQQQAMSYGTNMYGGAKTLRSGKWNGAFDSGPINDNAFMGNGF